jgi:cysteine desulfurase/selenocysteine lyase
MNPDSETISFDVTKIRNDFPILQRKVNSKNLIYFDNGATSQKPKKVIDSIANYYATENANIHRGVHTLSREITEKFENARKFIAGYFNIKNPNSFIFTRGTTESINLVAYGIENILFQSGSEIIITEMEHHSNILPWLELCKKKNGTLKVVPVNEKGEIDLNELERLINDKTVCIAITHISNTMGTINPVKEICSLAHSKNIPVLIDGAQSVPHMAIDLTEIDPDFFVFSAHKCFGPTGIGVLYMKEKWIKEFPVYQTGGGTIKTVTFNHVEYAEGPLKFEAGTPHIAGAIGLANALQYMQTIGLPFIHEYEKSLLDYATTLLKNIPGIRIIGEAKEKAGVISFVFENIHPYDIGTLLDQQGIAVRTGHHCTQPLLQKFGIQGTVRVSFAFYNTKEEIDIFIGALNKSIKLLQ